MLAVSPAALIPAGIAWVLVLVISGYVGLATMLAAASMPVWQFVSAGLADVPLLLFLVSLAAFIVFTHRANIGRMRRGEESRENKAMLLRRSR
jgi:glycerol-3-phosphate acyltransferase PlsY